MFLFYQDNKKFFKRSELARMEQEDYFKRCGYKVNTSVTTLFF